MARGLVDRVVVGADRIAANGDVANKVGTYPLAVLAARHGVPFYVAAPLLHARPRHARRATPSRSRSATPPRSRRGLPALNLAFDVTPAELVTAIVTEAGVLEAPYEEAIAAVARTAEIVATGREMLRLGLVAGTSGNVSAREGDLVRDHAERAAVRVDDRRTTWSRCRSTERWWRAQREPSSERRVHLAVYAARPDARALVHTHSEHATAWSHARGAPRATCAHGAVMRRRGSDEIAARGRGGAGRPRRGAAGRVTACSRSASRRRPRWRSARRWSGGRAKRARIA